jgi:hypothetical protein
LIASDRDELRPRLNIGGSSGRTAHAFVAKLLGVA